MVSKRNVSVQLIRIIAMFMIISDHLLSVIDFSLKSLIVQVSNSGVLIFLLISGFLFGNRKIDNWKKWFINRILRICVPMWIFMIVDFIVEFTLWNNFDVKYVFIYAFNLQGIFGVTIGGMNLWFLTLIMICYLITPALQWIKQKKLGRSFGIASLVIAIMLQVILAYTTDIGMVAGHTLSWCVIAIGMYVAGYFMGNAILSENIGGVRLIAMTVLTTISSVVVLLFNRKFDGQIIYDRIVIFYGMVMIDLWICMVLYKLGRYLKAERVLKVINHLDSISYEFYIVHGLIITAVTMNVLLRLGTPAYMLSTILLSWVAAVVLHKVCGAVYKRCK